LFIGVEEDGHEEDEDENDDANGYAKRCCTFFLTYVDCIILRYNMFVLGYRFAIIIIIIIIIAVYGWMYIP